MIESSNREVVELEHVQFDYGLYIPKRRISSDQVPLQNLGAE